MIFNTPSNPTGAMFDRECLQAIADLAQKHDFLVLSDEPYEDIVFDGRRHVSIASLDGIERPDHFRLHVVQILCHDRLAGGVRRGPPRRLSTRWKS